MGASVRLKLSPRLMLIPTTMEVMVLDTVVLDMLVLDTVALDMLVLDMVVMLMASVMLNPTTMEDMVWAMAAMVWDTAVWDMLVLDTDPMEDSAMAMDSMVVNLQLNSTYLIHPDSKKPWKYHYSSE